MEIGMGDPIFLILMPVHDGADYMEGTIRDLLAQTEDGWRLVIADLSSKDGSLEIAREWSRKHPDRIACLSPEELRPNSGQEDRQNRLFAAARKRWAEMDAGSFDEIQSEKRPKYFLLLEPMYHYDEELLATLRDSARRQQSDLIIYGMEEDFVNAKGDIVDYDVRMADTSFYCAQRTINSGKTEADDKERIAGPKKMPGNETSEFTSNLVEDEQAGQKGRQERDYERGLSDQARMAYRVGHQEAVYRGSENLREIRRELEEEGLLITASNKAYRMDFLTAEGLCPFRYETEAEMDEELTLSGIRANVKLLDAVRTLTVLGEALAMTYLDADLLEL